MSAAIQHIATRPKTSSAASNRLQPGTRPEAPTTAESLADRIRARAFQIYEARTANGGAIDPVSDWLQAERELCPSRFEPTSLEENARARARGELLLAGKD